ncbi:precorrin-6Y C5,15-methyltransferase, CbiT subunit [Lentilactobacillus rapi DSM 19907 = JCM 15042]|uniref:Cobalt-precorrin-6Y C(15)-methyltransferase n=2 Tax=Lentilactobacillus rapi TaxID=481723 RepID=A0A512PK77_9LACO|nr:decarboxylating cobalt-precorrin-6B (C(15))-methyltransferase [Lentilactobacillus rapi]KRL16166.1 precorrin-6Y C5,15-methyltransferase, CbiT subunit [Lentilactobacillus rapi DSM 19907 = JCM 15042]GEP71572.1 cobalt-precorrin-6Y C(15)-methyltransferase [Lentilactobacillus rapi]
MKDEEFLRTKVPMTKAEVRAVSIDKLQLNGKTTLLDVGAGTGSVSIQAAVEFPDLQVTSIEKNPDAIDIMSKNIEKFHTDNISLVRANAPEGIPDEDFDAIFIGGSGSNLKEIITDCLAHLKPGGALVLNFILIENALETYQALADEDVSDLEMTQVDVSKWHALGKGHYFKHHNSSIVLSSTKG